MAKVSSHFDKRALRAELVQVLAATLSDLERAHQAAREAATHEEAKPEDDKDTRALEQSYLARGQAQRVLELRTAVGEVAATPLRVFAAEAPAALGALVRVEEDGDPRWYFIALHGGGTTLAQGVVHVVTPKSPLGRALIGKYAGESMELKVADRAREITLLELE